MGVLDGMTEERLRQLLKQREEALLFLCILVDRAGGVVRIAPEEMAQSFNAERNEIGFTGVVELKATRP